MRAGLSIAVALWVAAPGCSVFLGDGDEPPDGPGNQTLTPDTVEVIDTWIYSGRPDDSHGAEDTIVFDQSLNESDGAINGEAAGLLRFDLSSLDGRSVKSATLHLYVKDDGDVADLYEVLADWSENTTWKGFGPAPGLDPDDFLSTGVVVSTRGFQASFVEVDVTESVAGWLARERENRGWLFRSIGSNGAEIFSREASRSLQPKLVVELEP